jgi:hypothetical protein
MSTYKTNLQKEMSLQKILSMIFIPSLISTSVYIFIGGLKQTIPSRLLFYICATLILFPIEIGIVLNSSKKEYGSYSLKSAFTNYNKMSWWKTFLYGAFLFGFAGIMAVTLAPLENSLFAPISNRLTQSMPIYFDWNNIEYLKQYSKDIVLLTCVVYFVFNVIVGPIIEELEDTLLLK